MKRPIILLIFTIFALGIAVGSFTKMAQNLAKERQQRTINYTRHLLIPGTQTILELRPNGEVRWIRNAQWEQ